MVEPRFLSTNLAISWFKPPKCLNACFSYKRCRVVSAQMEGLTHPPTVGALNTPTRWLVCQPSMVGMLNRPPPTLTLTMRVGQSTLKSLDSTASNPSLHESIRVKHTLHEGNGVNPQRALCHGDPERSGGIDQHTDGKAHCFHVKFPDPDGHKTSEAKEK